MEMSTIGFTVAFGQRARQDAERCRQTFARHHPDVPFLIFDETHYPMMTQTDRPSWPGEIYCFRSAVGWFLSKIYKRVIYLDADILVLARLADLLERPEPVLLTADYFNYTMRLHELPVINSGVLATNGDEGAEFWKRWTWSQYACLLPCIDTFSFNQIALRILAEQSGLRAIDAPPAERIYNVSLHDQSGEYRFENGVLTKGGSQIMLYHFAGNPDRSLENLPALVRSAIKQSEEGMQTNNTESPDFEKLWSGYGENFLQDAQKLFGSMPTFTLPNILGEFYTQTQGFYRSAAPFAWDQWRDVRGSGFQRVQDSASYIYSDLTNQKT